MNDSYDKEGVQRSLSPKFIEWQDIPHYYGDYVRALFVGSAVLFAIAIPVFGNLIPLGTFVQVASSLVLIILAGLTNPHSRMLLLYDAVVAAIGILLLESTVITYYAQDGVPLFVIRESAAVALMFALYFSIKTLRAMSLGKLGKKDRPWEFEDIKDPGDQK